MEELPRYDTSNKKKRRATTSRRTHSDQTPAAGLELSRNPFESGPGLKIMAQAEDFKKYMKGGKGK